MYVLGYSLDNLSLMALTIAVGFVVDDAIVMLENIYRHIEDGMSPMEAAFKGAGEIGFTIVSISLSLVAVFIPLLFMGGIVGRLFREFAITVSMTIFVSALVSLTLTPMMCSRFMRDKRQVGMDASTVSSERGFELLLAGYRKSLDVALRHHRIDLCRVRRDIGRDRLSLRHHPEGLFPATGYRPDLWHFRGAQDISFRRRGAPPAGPRRRSSPRIPMSPTVGDRASAPTARRRKTTAGSSSP